MAPRSRRFAIGVLQSKKVSRQGARTQSKCIDALLPSAFERIPPIVGMTLAPHHGMTNRLITYQLPCKRIYYIPSTLQKQMLRYSEKVHEFSLPTAVQ